MRKQSGVSRIALVAALAVIAAGGAGFFAWQNMEQVDRLKSELSKTETELNKARAELKQATLGFATSSKEAKDLKVATERLTAERDAVRTSLENEQATGVRLRAEVALAKDQISYLTARTSKDIVRGMPKAPSQ